MSQEHGAGVTIGADDLSQQLQQAVQAEVKHLAEWSRERGRAHTLGEMEQAVLAALRRLGPQLLAGLVESEAEAAPLSPPLRLWRADEGAGRASQADPDPDG